MEKQPNAPGLARVPRGTPTETPDGRTFIGGKSREFSGTRPENNSTVRDAEKAASGEQEDNLCSNCSSSIKDEFLFCSICGLDLGNKNIAKALGVEITEEDLSQYLFKGYLDKEVPLVHGKMAIFKTLLPFETEKLELEVMNHFKDKDGESIDITQKMWSNVYSMRTLAYGWYKFDGSSLGENSEDRYKRIREGMGGHLVDIASNKWNLFNRAVAAMLEDPDVLKNS